MVLGLGMGFLMQMVSLIAQNSVELRDMGVASSARMFFQQMGGSLGVAAFGALFAQPAEQRDERRGRQVPHHWRVARPGDGHQPAAAVQHEVFAGIAHAVQGVFVWVTPSALLVFVLALFIKEVPLRSGAPAAEKPAQEVELVA